MRHIRRLLGGELRRAARHFPVVILTGPRRAGKTTLLRRAWPRADYRLLEDPEVISRVRADPRAFLDELRPPAILDEIQHAPELLNHLRARADAQRGRACRWLLTGSQEAPLMHGVTESMAGRAAILQLLPVSCAESPLVSPWRGGFPEPLARPAAAALWYRSYLQTYLERDVRALTAVRDLATFRRFLALLAVRAGQTLNRADIAAPLGVSIPTVSQWIGILETTMQILLVPPYFENLGKRLVKSPKVHFVDSGLLCHLLGIESEAALIRSPFAGPVFEGFVAAEIAKARINAGHRPELYHFRDRVGLEVDFVVPAAGRVVLIEAKAGRTVRAADASPLRRLLTAFGSRAAGGWVIHWPGPTVEPASLTPGVRAAAPRDLGSILASAGGMGQSGT